MEEDIKILEEMRKKMNKTLSHKITKQEFQAIKNLIKGYRELEERIISLTNLLCINDSDENYNPKSKIKEKIEPVIDSLEKDGFVGYGDELRDIVSELMEDK